MDLLCLPHLYLQHPHRGIRLEQLQDCGEVIIRHHCVFGPYLAVTRLGVPVHLELLDCLVAVGRFVLGHDCVSIQLALSAPGTRDGGGVFQRTLSAVWRCRDGGGDLLV